MVQGRRRRQGVNNVWERREICKKNSVGRKERKKEDKKRENRTFKNRPL
jgi:hypothetical protein